ncbi:MAG: DUF2029 domain-containing protein [Methylacidiphilales bacterium]|nr:DUF2029 domain-containing protein [Candidatus Methylacidiphilales bacterium]
MKSLRAALILFRDEIWRPHRTWVLVFLFVFAAMCVLPIDETVRHGIGPKDYGTWWKVGLASRHGEALYPDSLEENRFNFFYPPAIAPLFYAPLSFGGPLFMVVVLCLLSGLGYLVSLLLGLYLATGKIGGHPAVLYIVPWLIGLPFAWDIYFLGQLNMTLLAVMLWGFLALQEKSYKLAGVLFALSAAAKAFPFTVIFYLIWRKYYAAAISMLAALAVILLVLPAPIRGFDRNLNEMRIWCNRMLLHNSGDALANQPDRAFRFGNQTLISVVNRLTRPLPVGKAVDKDMTVNIVSLSSNASFAIAGIIAGAMGLAFVLAMSYGKAASTMGTTANTQAIEAAIVLIFIVVFSPKAGSFYYCWVIPGYTVAIAEALRFPKGSSERRWIVGGLVCSLIVLASALSQAFTRVPQGIGVTMWGAVLLYVVLVGILWNRKRQAFPEGTNS